MTTFHFTPVDSLEDVAELRAARLHGLAALPELFVEAAVRRSAVYTVMTTGSLGYLTALDGTLTELFVPREHAGAALEAAADALALRYAWACTFDSVAMTACTASPRRRTVLGLSFRTLIPVALPTPHPMPVERLATHADIDLVRATNHPDVFDELADIPVWVGNGWVTLFEGVDGLVGFGLCSPAGPETLACDIGIRVCEAHQRRGLGAWIAQRMAARATARGLAPTAGCDAANVASQRTLERAGFVADHKLLQFELTPRPRR